MNLCALMKGAGIFCELPDCEITGITEHVENVTSGSIFVAVKGKSFDGNAFISRAFDSGAVCIVSEDGGADNRIIKTADSRVALAKLCSAFYSHPARKLKMIGITGTNGKTTVAEYVSYLLEKSGKRCGVIGTLGVKNGNSVCETGYTTPSPEILYKELDGFVKAGCEYCVMEVSSQALEQKRVHPITFQLAVFTNIGTDHLDRHGTFEGYLSAKASLFPKAEKALINADDVYAENIVKSCNEEVFTFSAKERFADFSAKDIRYLKNGISYIYFDKKNIVPVTFDGTGVFSVYNTLAAFACAEILGVEPSMFTEAAGTLPEIKGRMGKTEKDGVSVYVDFAHTPEAMQSVLSALRNKTENKLICVFGCGGDRDKSKRPLMGEIAARYADTVIVTSDNPRNENSYDISDDIVKGIKNKKSVIIENDRETAIRIALSKAKTGDTVLVAGKGHEEYQLIGNKKYYFSDEKTVKSILGLV